MTRKSRGRQKVEMTRMSKESNLLVTFSKRRSGLFKKASELCTLCAAEIAIIVFSPGKKVFSFGHPSVESIVDRFLSRNAAPSSRALELVEAQRNFSVRGLNVQLTELLNHLEVEKKRGEELDKAREAGQEDGCWWKAPINELGLQELEQLKLAMEELSRNVTKQAEKLVVEASVSNFPFPGASSSGGGYVGIDMNSNNMPALGFSTTPHGYPFGPGRPFF